MSRPAECSVRGRGDIGWALNSFLSKGTPLKIAKLLQDAKARDDVFLQIVCQIGEKILRRPKRLAACFANCGFGIIDNRRDD